MNFFFPKSRHIWCGILVGIFLIFLFGFPSAVSAYSFDVNLTGGAAVVASELTGQFGAEGHGWKKYGGDFVSDGYLLGTNSNLELKLPGNLPVGHVKIRFEAKGMDNDLASLEGVVDKDGYMFSMGKEWCDPCPPSGYDASCDATNWGLGIKKWPRGMEGVMFSNSILVQEWAGMFNGTGVPGASVGDSFNWEEYTGFYTIELELHAGSASGTLSVWKGDPDTGASPVLNSPNGIPYALYNYDNRDGIVVSIGGELEKGVSYGGVTIRNVSLVMEEETAPSDYEVSPIECPEDESEDGIYGVCACVGGSLSAPVPCEDKATEGNPRKATILDQFPFHFDKFRIKFDWTLKSIFGEGNSKSDEMQTPPSVDLQFAPPAPRNGEQVGAIANALNFRTRPNNLYYAWCLVDDGQVWPMNSVVAGGTRPENVSDKPFDEKGCCGPITRTPTVDLDNDGMDDNWERQMFIGREINGRTYNTIEEVLPDDDPDQDGFVANHFKNELGEYLTVAPAMVASLRDGLGNEYIAGQTGRFTNIQEYIAGTDPLNGDTDGDGYGDEMDYIGVGQSNVSFNIEKPAGPNGYYDIGVSVVGIDGRAKTALTSTKQRLFIGDDNQLEIELSANKDVITFGSDQSLVVKANTLAGTETNRVLYYEWLFNGDSACNRFGYENEDLCDVGLDELKFGAGGIALLDLPETTSEDYTVGVKVWDQVSRNEAEATLTLPVAYAVTLTTVCGDQEQEINSVPFDSGEILQVCIAEIDEIATSQPLGELNFVWNYDGVNQPEQSGLGKSEYSLVSDGVVGASHTLSVRIKDSNRAREFANGTRQFDVSGPRVAIVEPADRITYRDRVVPDTTRFISVSAGEKLALGAIQENFVGKNNWLVRWLVNGQVTEAYIPEAFMSGDQHSFVFEVPSDAPTGQVYGVGVEVSALDNDPPEMASDSIKLVVGLPSAAIGKANPFFSTLAAVFTQIPEMFRQIIVYAAILAGVFFGLVLVYPKASRFLENRASKK